MEASMDSAPRRLGLALFAFAALVGCLGLVASTTNAIGQKFAFPFDRVGVSTTAVPECVAHTGHLVDGGIRWETTMISGAFHGATVVALAVPLDPATRLELVPGQQAIYGADGRVTAIALPPSTQQLDYAQVVTVRSFQPLGAPAPPVPASGAQRLSIPRFALRGGRAQAGVLDWSDPALPASMRARCDLVLSALPTPGRTLWFLASPDDSRGIPADLRPLPDTRWLGAVIALAALAGLLALRRRATRWATNERVAAYVAREWIPVHEVAAPELRVPEPLAAEPGPR
jgi:hypothetical protein